MAEEVTPTATGEAPVPEQTTQDTELATTSATDLPPQPEPGATPITSPTSVAKGSDATSGSRTVEPKDIEEPQNALTRKFNDAEWKALKDLRSNLPNIFTEAFPERENAKTTPIKLWGVTIDPNRFNDARVSVILMKFLRARYLSVPEAQSMLISTLRWRDNFKPEDAMQENFPPDIFGELGHVYGKDKDGRPITYNLYGANKDLKAVFGDIQRFIRWRVALMEKGVALLDFETTDQMIQVHDYEGVTLSSRDANSKNAASEATSIFSSHYPELLYKKFFVNVPSLMTWIFWIFKPLISAQTIAKMSVVGSGSHTIGKALLPYVESDQLPERYGGKAEAF